MITIYGPQMSRASRCMWLLEELGLPYTQVPINNRAGENRTPEYLALNPSGKIPVLDDDGFVLRETLAICFYLVAKAPTPLWPDNPRTRALIHQWASWGVTELEGSLGVIFTERRRLAGVEPDAGFVAGRVAEGRRALDLLEGHLQTHRYVASDDFTLGDLIASSTVMLAPMFVPLDPYPAVLEWLARCSSRPAWKRVEEKP